MEFYERIKQIRKDNKLTQEDLANKLNVSRQAVSNWENNKNLPDIEMIIGISKVFSVSLDELIFGGKDMTKIEEKLIKDGSENRRAKMYMISNIAGLVFCILGITTIILKGATVEFIDEAGILHENFFLLPLGFAFITLGIVTVLIGLASYYKKTNDKFFTLSKLGYLLTAVFTVMTLLIYSNGNRLSVVSLILAVLGVVLVVISKILSHKKKQV